MNLFLCLEKIVPGSKYTVLNQWDSDNIDDNYHKDFYENDIIWEDEREKPSWESLRYVWVEVLARRLCDRVEELRNIHFYSNYPVQFSDGFGHIQFRDHTDWLIVVTNTVGVLQKVLYGAIDDPWEYRDYENVIHHITAKEMLDISNTMMLDKTIAWRATWDHKDALQSIYLSDTMTVEEKISELEIYDVETGWPESTTYETSATEEPSGE